MASREPDLIDYINTAANVASARYNARTAAAAERVAAELARGNELFEEAVSANRKARNRREYLYQASKSLADIRAGSLTLNGYVHALNIRWVLDEGGVTTEAFDSQEEKRQVDEANQQLAEIEEFVAREKPEWARLVAVAATLRDLGDKLELCIALEQIIITPLARRWPWLIASVPLLAPPIVETANVTINIVNGSLLNEWRNGHAGSLLFSGLMMGTPALLFLIFGFHALMRGITPSYRPGAIRKLPDWIQAIHKDLKGKGTTAAQFEAMLAKEKVSAEALAGTGIDDFARAIYRTENALDRLHGMAPRIKRQRWRRASPAPSKATI